MFFLLNTLQGTAKAPLNTLGGTKTAIETPKMYYKHPCPFYMGLPPTPRPRAGLASHTDALAREVMRFCMSCLVLVRPG